MKLLKTLMIASLFTLSTAALAHTGIKSTYPANEQMLDAAPKQLTLTFSAAVRLMKVTLMDGEHKDLGIDFKPSADAGTTFKVKAPELSMGEYMVSWVSMGKDGHKMTGDFSFMVHGEGMQMSPGEDHDEVHNAKKHDH
jgi:methionine-rich copper-binding protein CopC